VITHLCRPSQMMAADPWVWLLTVGDPEAVRYLGAVLGARDMGGTAALAAYLRVPPTLVYEAFRLLLEARKFQVMMIMIMIMMMVVVVVVIMMIWVVRRRWRPICGCRLRWCTRPSDSCSRRASSR
jgi:hypothetical protein